MMELGMSWVGVIGQWEARQLLDQAKGLDGDKMVEMSIDMGRTKSSLLLNSEGVHVASSRSLLATWDEIKKIGKKDSRCYALYDDGTAPWHVATLSENTGIPASLCPPFKDEQGAPTIILGGFTMHRMSGDAMNPRKDTENKIRAIKRDLYKGGHVLDTCMGLGYTAIEAAKAVSGGGGRVVTIEYDDASVEMASHNPWSKELFDGTLPIELLRGDASEFIKGFEANSFSAVVHDPPARALCRTDLYGLAFYKEIARVVRGPLFHYIGNPTSKESGRLYAGVMSRLREAGFSRVKKVEAAFGVVAYK